MTDVKAYFLIDPVESVHDFCLVWTFEKYER